MKVTYFIDRPVFSMVISILIVIVGFIGLTLLPIDQYPQITPPVVKISASYPGASALTVSQAVATPIEQELNGTPGMLYMESSSSNSGGFSATVTFDISADPDLAAVEIQNRVKLAESRLPAEVIQNGISVEKQAPSQLMTLCLTSDDPKFDEIYLSNFATINVLDVLRRIPGVGRVSNIGSRYYAMQIWVQPDKLANFGLTVQDVQNALKDQNRESAAGVLGQQPIEGLDITIPISTKGRLSTVSQFEEIVLRADADGSLIRLRDVARISLEAQSYNTESGINGGNAAVLGIYMLPGANAMEVAENVKKAMDEISKNFPEGLEYEIPFDMTTYISESIHEVYKTLFEALVLVIFVVFLSLQSWRATLIPVVAVPISLIGTFGFMLIFGFSLNMLTLLGLILAIGIVVDDAIVVVENVERIMEEEHLGAYGILNRLLMLFVMVIMGLTMGMQPIVGYNHGAHKFGRVKQTLKYCMIAGGCITSLGFAFSELFPNLVVNMFTDDKELTALARTGLQIGVLMFPFVGIQIVISSFFQSIGKAKISIFLSLSRQLLYLLPCLLLLPHWWGLNGIWLSMPVSDLLAFITACLMLAHHIKKLNKITEV